MTSPKAKGRVFWTTAALGGAVTGYGLYGLINAAGPGVTATKPLLWAAWLGGLALAHDLLLAPIVFATGRGLRRVTASLRASLQAALVTAGLITIVALPLLRAAQRPSSNPTIVPRDSIRDWIVLLVIVWGLAAANITRRALLHRRQRRAQP